MSTLQYQCAMSLDGFIAGANGDMSWLATGSPPAEDDAPHPLAPLIGAVLSGNRTFRGADPNAGTGKEGGYEGQYHGPQFVLTHHLPAAAVPGVTFVDDLERAIGMARAAAGDKLVGVLGANVARQCLELGELDEILLYLTPVLLGDGVRLFDRPGGAPVRLEVLEADGLVVRTRVVH